MSSLFDLGIVFAVTLVSYVIALLFGYVFARKGVLSFSRLLNVKERVTGPLTLRIHSWMLPHKLKAINQKRWWLVFLLIFLNNLFLVAFIGRTLCGLIFVVPYVLILLQGLAEGVACAEFKKAPNVMTVTEFGGYLFAAIAGISLGLAVLSSLFEGSVIPLVAAWQGIAYIYVIVVVLLSVGARIETSVLKNADLPDMSQVDLKKLTTAVLKMRGKQA